MPISERRKARDRLQRKVAKIIQEEGSIKSYPTESDADNAFWQRPERLKQRVIKETGLEFDGGILLRDYPYDKESGKPLDMKEYEYRFIEREHNFPCKLTVTTYGSGYLGGRKSEINALFWCDLSRSRSED